MPKWSWGVLFVAALAFGVGACGSGEDGLPPHGRSSGNQGGSTTHTDAGTTGTTGGNRDGGVIVVDGGEPDGGGGVDGGAVDGGTAPDGGITDGGTALGAGPWPTDAMLDYTDLYGVGHPQSVAVDDAYNIWLLKGDSIGVLRPGTTSPIWVSGIGQAREGFGHDALATGSTVICGGAANQAYVGYETYDLEAPERTDPNDPEFKKGDMDLVQLKDGTISLLTHIHESAGTSNPSPPDADLGIRNTNDWRYDEDRSVLTCAKVMRGPNKGDIYSGSNHGVTRIRGQKYDSHRHAIWVDANGHDMIGYDYGLGIGLNGDVLIANAWMVGVLSPLHDLMEWTDFHINVWKVKTYDQALNSLADFDYWRAFQQTTDGMYYVGSLDYGLWSMAPHSVSSAQWTKIDGLPSEHVLALAATDDGSLFIGTDGAGLWRMDANKALTRVQGVSGEKVLQLVYDPTVSPPTLYVLTDDGLTVLRGH